MPFLGTTPTQGFVGANPKQSFTANGSTTVFTLTHPVANANDLEVFVGNVRQEPTAAYTAAGTTLTMSEAPDTGLNFYVINKSQAQVTTTPPDGSISAAKMASGVLTPTAISDQANTSTGSFSFPVGTEAQRPGSPAEGMTRYNSDDDKLEVYADGAWQRITSNPPYDITYSVIAGGGSGGTAGGGGGAGGMRQGTLTLLVGTTYTVTIGAGGASVSRWGSGGNQGSSSVFGSITSIGGGSGGHGAGGSGGSGGGGAQGNGGSGTVGQGNDGGNGNTGSPGYPGGGGGGAGAAGQNAANSTTAGNGGTGLASTIDSVLYAGGGGGGTRTGTAGAGANGGGGGSNSSHGTAGTANTGGGGGGNGGSNNGTNTGAGGSGRVIIKVPDANYATSTLTGSPSTAQSGGFTTLTWTSSGTYTA